MPFKSQAQNRWAHTPAGTEALGGASKVKEWESATDYKHLPQKLSGGGPVYAKGDGGADTSYAKGGASLPRRENWAKGDGGDGKFKAGGKKEDWKQASLKEATTGHDSSGIQHQNTRTDNESPDRLGTFLSGGDRFTSQNFAEQGEPASMQRTKPDENWSKDHIPVGAQKNLRFGDQKSEKAVTPRGGGTRHGSVKGG